jgi:hypothetical protein
MGPHFNSIAEHLSPLPQCLPYKSRELSDGARPPLSVNAASAFIFPMADGSGITFPRRCAPFPSALMADISMLSCAFKQRDSNISQPSF